ncbi:MAG: ABC transporter substrate-binding protein [Desulfatibacillaceae bacterium]|nr:ABC transporter substrate-binding protein [Desulfatibacillaceae bacterium]
MKNFLCTVFFILALVLGSCAPKAPAPPAYDAQAARELFQQAQALHQAQKPDEAAQAYELYATKYPQASNAPEAWMQIASLALAKGNFAAAQRAFEKITGQYPRSIFAADARLGQLQALSAQGLHAQVLDAAPSLMTPGNPAHYRSKAAVLAGDSQLALAVPEQALALYAQALALAEPHKQDEILQKLSLAAQQASATQIQQAAMRAPDCASASPLVYALVKKHLAAGNMDEAAELFERFKGRCPAHPLLERFLALGLEIEKQMAFKPDLLGVLLPLTGPYARFGEGILAGVELFVSEHNSANPARPISLAIEDSLGTQQGTDQGFYALTQQKVAAVIGPVVHPQALHIPAREANTPAIVFAQREALPQPGSYLFRNYITPALQAKTLVSYAVEELGLTRFAILYPDDDYGRLYMNRFWDEVILHGGRITAVEPYRAEQTDFSEPIKKMVGLFYEWPEKEKNRNPFATQTSKKMGDDEAQTKSEQKKRKAKVDFDAIFIPDIPGVAALILPQLQYHDIFNVLAMGTNMWHSPQLLEWARASALGTIFPDLFFAGCSNPKVRRFVEAFNNLYGYDPTFWEALGYDSAAILVEAAGRPGVNSGKALRDALASQEFFDGVTGRTSFNDTGEVEKQLYLLRTASKSFVQIQR